MLILIFGKIFKILLIRDLLFLIFPWINSFLTHPYLLPGPYLPPTYPFLFTYLPAIYLTLAYPYPQIPTAGLPNILRKPCQSVNLSIYTHPITHTLIPVNYLPRPSPRGNLTLLILTTFPLSPTPNKCTVCTVCTCEHISSQSVQYIVRTFSTRFTTSSHFMYIYPACSTFYIVLIPCLQ